MLEIKNLEVAYGSITALHGINLRVELGATALENRRRSGRFPD